MFEKGKQWWKDRKIQEHIENNKDLYKGLGVGIVTVLILKDVLHPGGRTAQINVNPAIAPVFNNTPVIAPVFNNTMINNNGPARKVVQRLEDEKTWPMIKTLTEELAKEHNISPESARRMLSRYWAGDIPNVFDHHYERIATYS